MLLKPFLAGLSMAHLALGGMEMSMTLLFKSIEYPSQTWKTC
uniref:Uncharacterized protein n=1 Tax=Anguilla anguilla TaxID=7936 RepID=A0A0E9T5L9_ANGAN